VHGARDRPGERVAGEPVARAAVVGRAGAVRRVVAVLGGRQDRLARGVIDGEADPQSAPLLGGAFGTLDGREQHRVEPVAAPDHLNPHAVGRAARRLGAEVAGEQPHERADLGGRPGPVVGGERVQGEGLHAGARGRRDHPARGAGAGQVPGRAWATPPGRPAAVAVHDHRDMGGPGHGDSYLLTTLHCRVHGHERATSRADPGGQRARVARMRASMWSR
jgi:hypothetical protein